MAWNNTATQLIATRLVTSPALQIRILTYLSVAQYNAVIAVDRARESGTPPLPARPWQRRRSVVLTSSFPADAALLESTFDAQFPATDKDKGEYRLWRGDRAPSRGRGRSLCCNGQLQLVRRASDTGWAGLLDQWSAADHHLAVWYPSLRPYVS